MQIRYYVHLGIVTKFCLWQTYGFLWFLRELKLIYLLNIRIEITFSHQDQLYIFCYPNYDSSVKFIFDNQEKIRLLQP